MALAGVMMRVVMRVIVTVMMIVRHSVSVPLFTLSVARQLKIRELYLFIGQVFLQSNFEINYEFNELN